MALAFYYISQRIPVLESHLTVAEAHQRLKESDCDGFQSIYVIDKDKKLRGRIKLSVFLNSDPKQKIQDLTAPVGNTVSFTESQEKVAQTALTNKETEISVVDADGIFLGVIPSIALIEILRQEHVEDLHRIAGLASDNRFAREAIEAPPVSRIRHRLPWLLVGGVGSFFAIYVTSYLENSIANRIEVAYFVPAIVYMADAVGTQTETIVIRGLSLTQEPASKSAWNEVRTGALIGLLLGIVTFFAIFLFYHDAKMAFALGLSISLASLIATGIGFSLPYAISRSGQDPAFGSGPLATIIQDIMSLVIYVLIIRMIL